MSAMNETSPTKAADPVSVLMSSNCSRLSGSAVFIGLQEESVMPPTTRGSDAMSDNVVSPIAGNDRYVASEPQPVDWFKVALQDAHAAGFITSEGLKRVQTALYGRDGACE